MALPTSGPLSIQAIVNELSSQFDLIPPYSLRALSSLAGFSTPDSISEFYGYNGGGGAVTKYFVVRNMISRAGRNTREKTFSGAYKLYEKPNNSNTSIYNYNLIKESEGNPSVTQKLCDMKGIKPCTQLYQSNHAAWLTTVVVTITGGVKNFTFPNGGTATYGTQFYINIVDPYV